uniref:Protein kinase domain-containing protein n=2 Tax=Clytia hemisphaerica TaxID=252671 RepID=A0A7M5U3F3_9CNID
ELHDLLTKLLNHDPALRPSTSEIINHSWLTPSPSVIETESENSVEKEQKEIVKTVSQHCQVSVHKDSNEKAQKMKSQKSEELASQDVRVQSNEYQLRTFFIADNKTFKRDHVNVASNPKFPNGHHFQPAELWDYPNGHHFPCMEFWE